MPRFGPQPPDQRGAAWLLHSAMAWALTGAVMTVAHRPLWHAVGVVLLVLGLGVVGWVARGLLREQPLRQRTQAEGTGRTAALARDGEPAITAVFGLAERAAAGGAALPLEGVRMGRPGRPIPGKDQRVRRRRRDHGRLSRPAGTPARRRSLRG
jgi:hypothetical protein